MEYSYSHCGALFCLVVNVFFQTINVILFIFYPRETWNIHVDM